MKFIVLLLVAMLTFTGCQQANVNSEDSQAEAQVEESAEETQEADSEEVEDKSEEVEKKEEAKEEKATETPSKEETKDDEEATVKDDAKAPSKEEAKDSKDSNAKTPAKEESKSETLDLEAQLAQQAQAALDASGTDAGAAASGKTEVSRVFIEDCGSDTGYWEVTYSDGSIEYIDEK